MKLTKRDGGQLRPMSLRNAISRLFDESFLDPFNSFFDHRDVMRLPFHEEFALVMPKSDVSESKDQFKVEVDLPGYDPEKVNVKIDNNLLTVSGKMEAEKEDKDKKYYRRERTSGQFYREFLLPSNVDSDKAECKFKNGTLTVVMPKNPEKEGKSLKVKVE